MKRLAIIGAVVALAACNRVTPEQTTRPGVDGTAVERLFTVDGITVYRFYDAGRNVYFTSNGATHHTENCGKSCTVTVETLGVPK